MSEMPINARVECSDGPAGKSVAVIMNPAKGQVSHIVVEDSQGVKRLVELDQVAESSHELIQLRCSNEELTQMPPFTELHYVETAGPGGVPGVSPIWVGVEYMSPYVVPVDDSILPVEEECVPPGELAFHRGATVEATDGHIGDVEEFIYDPERGLLTHLILREGHFWGKHDITIPLAAVDRFEDDVVYLKLDKEAVKSLPSVKVKRFG